jgi:hypothetical protein
VKLDGTLEKSEFYISRVTVRKLTAKPSRKRKTVCWMLKLVTAESPRWRGFVTLSISVVPRPRVRRQHCKIDGSGTPTRSGRVEVASRQGLRSPSETLQQPTYQFALSDSCLFPRISWEFDGNRNLHDAMFVRHIAARCGFVAFHIGAVATM